MRLCSRNSNRESFNLIQLITDFNKYPVQIHIYNACSLHTVDLLPSSPRLHLRLRPTLGESWQNTVLRVQFRKREIGKSCAKLGDFCENSVSLRAIPIMGRKEPTELSPPNSVRAKQLTVSGVGDRTLRNRICPVSNFALEKPIANKHSQRSISCRNRQFRTPAPPSEVYKMDIFCVVSLFRVF